MRDIYEFIEKAGNLNITMEELSVFVAGYGRGASYLVNYYHKDTILYDIILQGHLRRRPIERHFGVY